MQIEFIIIGFFRKDNTITMLEDLYFTKNLVV